MAPKRFGPRILDLAAPKLALGFDDQAVVVAADARDQVVSAQILAIGPDGFELVGQQVGVDFFVGQVQASTAGKHIRTGAEGEPAGVRVGVARICGRGAPLHLHVAMVHRWRWCCG